MFYYGLVAKGSLVSFDGSHTIVCGKIFSTIEAATNYSETFKKACGPGGGPQGNKSLSDLEPETIIVQITKLELYE